MTLEEIDLLALAVAAGGYARVAFEPAPPEPALRRGPAGWLLLLVYGALFAVSTQRGLADAGGLAWGWWQGYHEPMNVLRLAKAPALALILLPLAGAWWRRDATGHGWAWVLALAGAMAVIGALTVWERAAYTGLMNFSSDYRATALFWEMHVGGAALDAALALTVPFGVMALVRARGGLAWGGWAFALALGVYASLATFSRIVYLAVPVGWAVLLALLAVQRRARGGPPTGALDEGARGGWLVSAVLVLVFAGLAAVVFPAGGYRGLLALAGAVALLLPAAGASRRLPGAAFWAVGLAGGVVLAAAAWVVAAALAKGAYLAYGASGLLGAGAALASWRQRSRAPARGPVVESIANTVVSDALLVAALVATAAGVALVSRHWGGMRAGAAPVLVAMALAFLPVLLRSLPRAPWPDLPRWQASRLALMGAVGLCVAVFGGGKYMGERFSSSDRDLGSRMGHWTQALSMLSDGTEGLFGRGVGRYPAAHFMSGRPEDQTGDHRLLQDAEGSRLLLTSGKHLLGFGELYRLSQRIAAPPQGLQARLKLRVDQATELHAEVCEKNLLYTDVCVGGNRMVEAAPGKWQDIVIPMVGKHHPERGPWYAPRLIVFSMALASQGSKAEIAQVQLAAGEGAGVLDNGDFSQGLARWYMTSDHHHMPWHAKNLLVHLWFEQGLAGLLSFTLLVVAALWTLVVGALRQEPLAPPAAAALVGLLIVGFADSLLDIPRVALVAYLLMGLALTLPGRRAPARPDPGPPQPAGLRSRRGP